MLKIGITGGIGSGKTTVCRIFELLGIPVYYADARAKVLMQSDQELIADIKHAFGDMAYTGSTLNRPFLASVVFNNTERLEKLNSLVHPAVFRDFDKWAAGQSARYVLKEAAILFESGSHKDCNYTILVKSPLQLRISRVMSRDKIGQEDVMKRIEKQMSDEEKEMLADFIILNDEINLVTPQILEIHKRLIDIKITQI